MDRAKLYLMMIWFDPDNKHYITKATAGPLSQAVETSAPVAYSRKDYDLSIDYLNLLFRMLHTLGGLKQKVYITHFQKRPHTWSTGSIHD